MDIPLSTFFTAYCMYHAIYNPIKPTLMTDADVGKKVRVVAEELVEIEVTALVSCLSYMCS